MPATARKLLAAIPRERPDLIVTDLLMPEMNGLELVEEVKRKHPSLPVILMTAHGSEEIALRALQQGAASYVPKQNLATDLVETVLDVLDVLGAAQERQRLLDECWMLTESQFLLSNDLGHIPALIGHIQDNLTRMKVCDENDLVRVTVALREALSNAIIHGNLEVSSGLRDNDENAYYALIEAAPPRLTPTSTAMSMSLPRSRARRRSMSFATRGQGLTRPTCPIPGTPPTSTSSADAACCSSRPSWMKFASMPAAARSPWSSAATARRQAMDQPNPLADSPSTGRPNSRWKQARKALLGFLDRWTILVVTLMFVVGSAVVAWHVDRLQASLVESAAQHGCDLETQVLVALRGLYTSEVTERVRPHGIAVAHDYLDSKWRGKAIPLPVTFTTMLGDQVSDGGSGMQVRVYSDFPFPKRKEEGQGGPRDSFETEALASLAQSPDRPFFRLEQFQGHPVIRYAVADRMRASCLHCHNDPKTEQPQDRLEGRRRPRRAGDHPSTRPGRRQDVRRLARDLRRRAARWVAWAWAA